LPAAADLPLNRSEFEMQHKPKREQSSRTPKEASVFALSLPSLTCTKGQVFPQDLSGETKTKPFGRQLPYIKYPIFNSLHFPWSQVSATY
jgi:hypothetical protein